MLSSSYLTINVPGFVPPRPSRTVFRSERSPSAFRVLLRLVIRQRSLVSLVARSSMGNTSSLTCISVDYAVSLVRPRRVIHAGLLVVELSLYNAPKRSIVPWTTPRPFSHLSWFSMVDPPSLVPLRPALHRGRLVFPSPPGSSRTMTRPSSCSPCMVPRPSSSGSSPSLVSSRSPWAGSPPVSRPALRRLALAVPPSLFRPALRGLALSIPRLWSPASPRTLSARGLPSFALSAPVISRLSSPFLLPVSHPCSRSLSPRSPPCFALFAPGISPLSSPVIARSPESNGSRPIHALQHLRPRFPSGPFNFRVLGYFCW